MKFLVILGSILLKDIQDENSDSKTVTADVNGKAQPLEAIKYLVIFFSVVRFVIFIVSLFRIKVCHLFYYNEVILSALIAFYFERGLQDWQIMLKLYFCLSLIDFASFYTNYFASLVCSSLVVLAVLISRIVIYKDDPSSYMMFLFFSSLVMQLLTMTLIHLFMTQVCFSLTEKELLLQSYEQMYDKKDKSLIVVEKDTKDIITSRGFANHETFFNQKLFTHVDNEMFAKGSANYEIEPVVQRLVNLDDYKTLKEIVEQSAANNFTSSKLIYKQLTEQAKLNIQDDASMLDSKSSYHTINSVR